MTDNPAKCKKCGSPLTPGMKFCESCGTKIEAVTACPKCGGALVPNMKFCGICGATLDPAAPAQTDQAEAIPVAAQAAPQAPPAPGKTPVAEVKSPVKKEEKAIPVPEEKPAPVPVKEPPKTEKVKELPKETGGKKPMSSATMIIAGIVILALLGAAVYFVVLPMFSGSGNPVQVPAAPSGTPVSGTSGTGSSSSSGTASLVPGPTDVPPNNLALIIDVEKNAISRDIIVTFQGGEGQYGVRELVITVTRSDGTTETKSMTHLNRQDSITVKGTDKADRVEITANFYSGETYKIIDKVFEYKKRVGSY